MSGSRLLCFALINVFFTVSKKHSARPLDWGNLGEQVTCSMFEFSVKLRKHAESYTRPLSLTIRSGMPNSAKICLSIPLDYGWAGGLSKRDVANDWVILNSNHTPTDGRIHEVWVNLYLSPPRAGLWPHAALGSLVVEISCVSGMWDARGSPHQCHCSFVANTHMFWLSSCTFLRPGFLHGWLLGLLSAWRQVWWCGPPSWWACLQLITHPASPSMASVALLLHDMYLASQWRWSYIAQTELHLWISPPVDCWVFVGKIARNIFSCPARSQVMMKQVSETGHQPGGAPYGAGTW